MSLTKETLLQAIPHLAGKQIVVIGDLILDEYLTGSASRLSREAPIPVLEFVNRRVIPGGAANPAMNIAALGSIAHQIGLIGADTIGQELVHHLHTVGIKTDHIVLDSDRCTTQKTRIVSQGNSRFPQQLARLDRIDRHPPSAQIEAAIINHLEQVIPLGDAILVSDYRNGVLTPPIVAAILKTAQLHHKLVVVDSQGNLNKYTGYHIIRANDRDTAHYLNTSLTTEADFQRVTVTLMDRLATQGVVIGRGAEGVSLREREGAYHHFPAAQPHEVFDVTGAGDTSTAVLALGLTIGLNLAAAALLANYAAGLVVQKLGNVTPTAAELQRVIEVAQG